MNAPADEMFKFQVSVSSLMENILYLGKKILWFRNDGLNLFLLLKKNLQCQRLTASDLCSICRLAVPGCAWLCLARVRDCSTWGHMARAGSSLREARVKRTHGNGGCPSGPPPGTGQCPHFTGVRDRTRGNLWGQWDGNAGPRCTVARSLGFQERDLGWPQHSWCSRLVGGPSVSSRETS